VLAFLGIVSFVAIGPATRLPIPSWPTKGQSKATTVLGLTCTVLNVCMYAAPLGVVRTVIRQRSVQAMPLPLTVCTGFCSACWTVYALLVTDDFILVPNVAGLALFALQLLVYGWHSPFCSKAPGESEASRPLATNAVGAGCEPADSHDALVSPVADVEARPPTDGK